MQRCQRPRTGELIIFVCSSVLVCGACVRCVCSCVSAQRSVPFVGRFRLVPARLAGMSVDGCVLQCLTKVLIFCGRGTSTHARSVRLSIVFVDSYGI